MIKRIDQQLMVNRLLIDYYNPDIIEDSKCRKYMQHYLEIITAISSVMCYLSKKEENYEKKKDLWKYLKSSHPETYRKLKRNPMGFFINIPGRTGRLLTTGIYRIVKKIFNFN